MKIEPLSQSLVRILGGDADPENLTINQLLERTEGRGVYLVIILLALPFVVPVPLLGLSTILGAVVAWLAVRLALGKTPKVPHRFGDRKMPPGLRKKIRAGGVKILRVIEKQIRPRRSVWMTWPVTLKANAAVLALLALLLTLPVPIAFTNTFPALAIVFVAASMMEEDGLMIWMGYAMSLAAVVYFGLLAGVIATHLVKWVHSLLQFLQLAS